MAGEQNEENSTSNLRTKEGITGRKAEDSSPQQRRGRMRKASDNGEETPGYWGAF